LAKQRETLFKEKVLRELKKFPKTWFCKIQQVSKRGTPDILATIGGVFVAIELKTDAGVLSKLQEFNLAEISKTGAIAIVMTPTNFDKYMRALRGISIESIRISTDRSILE